MVLLFVLMEINMKVNGLMIKFKEKDHLSELTEIIMKGTGEMIKYKEKV